MKYHVTIGGTALEVEVDGDTVRIGDRVVKATLRRIPGTPLVHLVVGGASGVFPLEGVGRGRWRLHDRGEDIEVEVLDERTRHIRSLLGVGKAQTGPSRLVAPMPGLVLRVQVAVGDTVGTGDGLLVLEAMKMENEIKARGTAVVARILVTPGQAVEKGAPLIEFEPSAGA